eukprot:197434_1
MATQVEGSEPTRNPNDGLDRLQNELSENKVLYIADICIEHNEHNTLQELVQWRKVDILQLVDEINDNQTNQHKIDVSAKNRFAKILSQYAQNLDNSNVDDPNKHVWTDTEERCCIIELSQRIKALSAGLISIGSTVKGINDTIRNLEKEINETFQQQIDVLNIRKKELLNQLQKIANEKTNALNRQAISLKEKLTEADKVYKKMNNLIKKPISLEEMEERKKLVMKQCDGELQHDINPNPIRTANISFSADTKSIQSFIKTFGTFNDLDVPILLSLENGEHNKQIVIKWKCHQTQPNINDMKIEWISESTNVDEKENSNDWKSKTVSSHSNSGTITVESAGSYTVRICYENAPKSNIKTIKIPLNNNVLIIGDSEIKELESDTLHIFERIIVGKNARLTVKKWDGANGGKLLVKAKTIQIKESGQIETNGKGFKGGRAKKAQTTGKGFQGESHCGKCTENTESNFGGGGGGWAMGGVGSAGGGGGGYGSKGQIGHINNLNNGNRHGGQGGDMYGDAKLSQLYLGSGGGSGHPYQHSGCGKEGGNGGGAISIECDLLEVGTKAIISSNGMDAPSVNNAAHQSGGGGGSGGSILIQAKNIKIEGTISSVGGKGGDKAEGPWCSKGGEGGDGRICIKCSKILGIEKICPSPFRG